MKRRAFLKLGAILLAGSIFLSYLLRFRHVIRNIIIDDTEGMLKDPGDVDTFIDDAEKEGFWNSFSLSKKIFIALHYYSQLLKLNLPMVDKYYQIRNRITGQFLLSTTLFLGAKNWNNKVVQYIGFYNPYKQPCSNPFSSMYFSPIN